MAPAPDGEAHGPEHHQIGDRRLADVEPGERGLVPGGGAGVGADGLVIAPRLALLGAEIFDGLVVQQAVDGAADGAVVDLVHLALQLGAPVSDPAGEGDIDGDDRQCRRHHAGPELEVEDDADRRQLDQGRGDVEQQEIEHHVDALGAALDDFGQAAGAPLEVKAQRQSVDVAEYPRRQPPRRLLANLLEHRVAQIVGQHGAEPRRRISRDQGDDRHRRGPRPAHRIDHPFEGVRDHQPDRLAGQHQHQSSDHPRLQLAFALGPQQRQKAQHDLQAGVARGGFGCRLGHSPLK